MGGPSPGVRAEQNLRRVRERAKEQAEGKGLPGRGKGGCKGSEVGSSSESLRNQQGSVVQCEVGELGQGLVKGAL